MRTLGWSLNYSLRLFVLTVSPCRRFEEVVSEEEAEVEKSAKRRRVSDATEQDAPTSDKLSKKAKKLKAENGAAVPAPTGTDAEASKKGKKNKKKKGEDAKESHPQTGEDKESEPRQKQGDKGNMRELPGGLQIRDAKPGEGPQAKKGVRLSMRYVGKLPNGKVFDSNTTGKPVRLRVAACTHSPKTHVIVSLIVHVQVGGWRGDQRCVSGAYIWR
jgi:FK506-binding nuclear protein